MMSSTCDDEVFAEVALESRSAELAANKIIYRVVIDASGGYLDRNFDA